MVSSLKHTVSELIKWGEGFLEIFEQNDLVIERELVQLYKVYYDIPSTVVVPSSITDLPKFRYGNIRINISFNFPNFGFYPVFLPQSRPNIYQPHWETKDAMDDLAVIIYHLHEVQWLFSQNREGEAIGHFKGLFDRKLRVAIINLLNYLRNQQEDTSQLAASAAV